MRLVFLGAPGVGKGTQAEKLSKRFEIPHIATGDILRAAISNKTPVGVEAKSYMDSGKLVPDEVIINIIRERLRESDIRTGYILDGFPRTINQAEALTKTLAELNQKIDRVLYFDLDEDELIKRISGRRNCAACRRIYHMVYSPSKQDGICDDCHGALVQRKDDLPETVKERLSVYRSQTAPLIRYYEKQGLLSKIAAGGPIDEIFGRVQQAAQKSLS